MPRALRRQVVELLRSRAVLLFAFIQVWGVAPLQSRTSCNTGSPLPSAGTYFCTALMYFYVVSLQGAA